MLEQAKGTAYAMGPVAIESEMDLSNQHGLLMQMFS